jgi:hypothetical protein
VIYTLIERCCGSAALTFHRLGAKKSILPYQGGKWRYRHALSMLLDELGVHGPPARVVLTDAGPWGGMVTRVLLGLPRGARQEVVATLQKWVKNDPKEVYDRLHGEPASRGTPVRVAEFLFLQRLAHSGKAVGLSKDDRWMSPGFNKTSAYGTPATGRFGAIRPMIPVLIGVLQSYEEDLTHLVADDLLTAQTDAAASVGRGYSDHEVRGRVVEYIDPPYAGVTPYPGAHLQRGTVVEMALAARRRGATVLVSEAEPIAELIEQGWAARELRTGRSSGTSPFKSKKGEWVTFKG